MSECGVNYKHYGDIVYQGNVKKIIYNGNNILLSVKIILFRVYKIIYTVNYRSYNDIKINYRVNYI